MNNFTKTKIGRASVGRKKSIRKLEKWNSFRNERKRDGRTCRLWRR